MLIKCNYQAVLSQEKLPSLEGVIIGVKGKVLFLAQRSMSPFNFMEIKFVKEII